MHGRALIAFFSASPSRRTEKVAHKLADVIGAELYEIVPAAAYSKDDLNWNDCKSRSSIEMNDPNSRPEIAGDIINTFLEHYDLTGKTVVPFATSGGSPMGQTTAHLRPSAKGAQMKEGRRFEMGETPMAINSWIAALGI